MSERSAQSRIDKYTRKIRKIEEEENKKRRIILPLESSSDEGDGKHELNCDPIPESTIVAPVDPQKAGSISNDYLDQKEDLAGPGLHEEAATSVSDLDPEILAALGDSTSDSPEYGENIHDKLSEQWLPLLKKGMPKENKDKLIREYLVPDNCRLLQAPKLNAEISEVIPEMARNRDKDLTTMQQQLGLGITAINRAFDLLLKNDNKILAMKHLSKGCRLLCDCHFLETQNRIKLISISLDRSVLNVDEIVRDDSLFGSAFSEEIKAIKKQGLSIIKLAKPQKSSSSRSSSYQGNWHAQPRYPTNRGYRERGGYNWRQPMTSGFRRPYAASAQQPQRASTLDEPRAQGQSHH